MPIKTTVRSTKDMRVPATPGADGGFFALAEEIDSITQNLKCIAFTNPGERFMRSGMGVPLMELVFEPTDTVFKAIVKTHFMIQVGRYEPRVILKDVLVIREVITSGPNAGGYRVRIVPQCVLKNTPQSAAPIPDIIAEFRRVG